MLRDKDKFQEFYRLVSLTPYSKNEFDYCKNNLDKEEDEIKRAYMFFIINRQSFSGIMDSWGYDINELRKNTTADVSKYLSIIELLPEIHRRIMRVQIDNRDFRDILKVYDDIDTFFYCDPPYLHETRTSFDDYKYEMTYEDHKDLINILSNIKGKVMLSGYQNDLYEQLNWKRIDFDAYCHAVNTRLTLKRPKRIESIWINYNLGNDLVMFK